MTFSFPEIIRVLERGIFPASTFLVALSSLIISLLTFRRDNGLLDVSIGVGEIWEGEPLKKRQDVINIHIVNSGRRPVALNSIGGDNKWGWLITQWSKINRHSKRRASFLFTHPRISSVIFPDGPRVLEEGQAVSITLPLPEFSGLLGPLVAAKRLYIFDSLSRKHTVSRKNIRKLRNDVRALRVF